MGNERWQLALRLETAHRNIPSFPFANNGKFILIGKKKKLSFVPLTPVSH